MLPYKLRRVEDMTTSYQAPYHLPPYYSWTESLHYNKGRRPAPKFKIGDLVMVHKNRTGNGDSPYTKLEPVWQGPYTIIKINPEFDTYTVHNPNHNLKEVSNQYLVKWAGYPVNNKDWLNEEDIDFTAIEEYWQKNNYTKAMSLALKLVVLYKYGDVVIDSGRVASTPVPRPESRTPSVLARIGKQNCLSQAQPTHLVPTRPGNITRQQGKCLTARLQTERLVDEANLRNEIPTQMQSVILAAIKQLQETILEAKSLTKEKENGRKDDNKHAESLKQATKGLDTMDESSRHKSVTCWVDKVAATVRDKGKEKAVPILEVAPTVPTSKPRFSILGGSGLPIRPFSAFQTGPLTIPELAVPPPPPPRRPLGPREINFEAPIPSERREEGRLEFKLDHPLKFSGKRTELENFLFTLNNYIRSKRITEDEDRIPLMILRLEGDMLTWWRGNDRKINGSVNTTHRLR
ncbi:hypothetical protein DFH27DRAFT_617812 [Peziza echinospora]|nr:hypothetical protein DFH27DRAFT_617812 [Peziza echinospora]